MLLPAQQQFRHESSQHVDCQVIYSRSYCSLSGVQDAEKAARKLTDEAYCRGSNDNISCVVVRFNFGGHSW